MQGLSHRCFSALARTLNPGASRVREPGRAAYWALVMLQMRCEQAAFVDAELALPLTSAVGVGPRCSSGRGRGEIGRAHV